MDAVDAMMTIAACSLTVTRLSSRWGSSTIVGALTVEGPGVDPPENAFRGQHGVHSVAKGEGENKQ